jgi:hypothetical protein
MRHGIIVLVALAVLASPAVAFARGFADLDFDGDGRTDLAVYRQLTGQWIIFLSSTGTTIALTFGCPPCGDIPVAYDFDSDGVTDLAVYRATTGQHFVLLSSIGFGFVTFFFGVPAFGDIPLNGTIGLR